MPFPVRLLSADEEVAVETRPHWTYLAGQMAAFVVLGAVAITVAVIDSPLPAVVVAAALAGVAAVALAIRLVRWANTYYLVTDRRIVHWRGVPAWSGIELRLDLVEEIEVFQTIRQRMLRVGTLAVHSVVGGHVRNLASVPRPVDVRREVYRLLREAEVRRLQAAHAPEMAQPPEADQYPEAGYHPESGHYSEAGEYPEAFEPAGGGEAHGASVDIFDQIRKLYELVEQGILSEAEFEEKKRDLLGRL